MGATAERLEILKMVADRVISAEEGERLIAAVEKAEAKKRSSSTHFAEMSRGFAGVGRGFAGMGKTIAQAVDHAVRSAMRGTDKVGEGECADPGNEASYEVPEGATLLIENSACGDGSISVSGGPGDRVVVRSGARHRFLCEGDRMRVEWPGGDLEVIVPDLMAAVSAAAFRGDIRICGIDADLDVRTLTGNVLLEIPAIRGGSRVVTMSGDIRAVLGPEFTGRVEAQTLGGEIAFAEGLGEVVEPPVGMAPRTAVLAVGDDPGAGTLVLEAGGGSISVEGAK